MIWCRGSYWWWLALRLKKPEEDIIIGLME